ncbi:Prenyltransferase and squalene oxidase repeat-containing protein [Micromonospora citrea]|uniref:Prenyltransferase and squalene oxidase repeat-containing protein n=1 Tax=Micromonospora citrea TaxID=47855 RepID=A0A1C6VU41_9ACTN|nr:prenyltransferase/squalene oxidase repeat-containing protein [Micromonospora citrea]SCL69868.1 Prenyltransferase and squalene oxidase repeat-containing protein [Micromonospora citrea]
MSDGGSRAATTPAQRTGHDPDGCADLARELVATMALRPWGEVAPSVYETGRLVVVAPRLAGHAERVAFLVRTQRADGAWGPPEGYALVPTLSATEALLAALTDEFLPATARPALADAAGRGLRALSVLLAASSAMPDTPAADLIVPALVDSINARTAGPDAALSIPYPLNLPTGTDRHRLTAVRAAHAAGADLPPKLAHFGELLHGPAPRSRAADPTAVGASPAATAAWLAAAGPDADGREARVFLERVVGEGDGAVPCPMPITVFERAWVLGGLSRAGVPVQPPRSVLASLTDAVGPAGVATGAGLPTDADTTAVTLYALGRLGRPIEPTSLWAYETAEGFCTWPGEDGFSVTTNAHVLDALGQHAVRDPGAARYRRAVDRLTRVLRERQEADGSWHDRWHASPYYATACCVLALTESTHHGDRAGAVDRAVCWVLANQRDDGSWGRWEGTAEETAYALQILLAVPSNEPAVVDAVLRGHAYLRARVGRREHPPLWYGKELYCPTTIVRAAVVGAVHIAHRWPGNRRTAGHVVTGRQKSAT